MKVVLLGTGAADGWPNPWCRCASCTWARAAGMVRAHTAALVDGRLLVDAGPDVARQADRAGTGLAGIATVLLTHGHWDHADPATLLARSWSGRRDPLQVLGPPGALARLAEWRDHGAGAPADGLELVPLQPGDAVAVGAYRVRALAAGHSGDDAPWDDDPLADEALLYDITDGAGASLLYATDTGPPPEATVEAVAGRAYDLVLLDETFGSVTDHGTGHLDLHTFPRTVATLRRVGAVTARTDIVAVHLGHHNPPADELDARLADWGARTVPDLTTLQVPDECGLYPIGTDTGHIHRTPPPRELVLGGARSGKSRLAESRLAALPVVTYVATGGRRDDDPEWVARVAAHRARRPAGWRTRETTDVAEILRSATAADAVLVDCLALWLTAVMDGAGCWQGTDPTVADAAVERCVRDLVAAVRATAARVVLVSNEVGSGVVPDHASGRAYRDRLGDLNARVADACDAVTLVVAGRVVPLRMA